MITLNIIRNKLLTKTFVKQIGFSCLKKISPLHFRLIANYSSNQLAKWAKKKVCTVYRPFFTIKPIKPIVELFKKIE